MALSPRNSLSEDWEDVGDDNLSIISFSSSDDEAPLVPTKAKKQLNLSVHPKHHPELRINPDESHAATGISTFPPLPTDDFTETATFGSGEQHCSAICNGKGKATDTSRTPSHPQDGSGCAKIPATLLPDVEASVEDPHTISSEDKSQVHEDGSEGTQDETVAELLGSHTIKPEFILKTLQSLDGLIDDTVEVLQESVALDRYLLRIPIIHVLRSQVAELMPIISGYARIWYGTSQDLPLDPGLHEWLSGVRVKMISLHAELQLVSRMGENTVENKGSLVDKIWDDLENYHNQMADFLPIMQVDYSEFQTKSMNLAIVPTDWSAAPVQARSAPIDIPKPPSSYKSQTSRPTRPRPSSEGWLLRRELYNLKDEIQRAIEHLSNISSLQPSRQALANDVIKSYKTVSQTISVVLSNHSSEWIESSLSGGLTFAEFMELDAECIRDFTLQLERTVDEIDPQNTSYMYTIDPCPDMLEKLGESYPQGNRSWLERLESVAQILMATLSPERTTTAE